MICKRYFTSSCSDKVDEVLEDEVLEETLALLFTFRPGLLLFRVLVDDDVVVVFFFRFVLFNIFDP